MLKLIPIRNLYALGLVALAGGAVTVALLNGLPAQAQPDRAKGHEKSQSPEAAKADWTKFHYQEAKDCKQCHTAPIADRKDSLDLSMLTEFGIWKTFDKHAQSYAVLKGERGRKMAEKLKQDVLKPETGCLSCHAMNNLPGREGAKLDLEDGVSCAGCHGPSGGDGGWLGPHAQKTWRDKTPEEKYKLGMRDLRHPVVRAELCMSCHVGSSDEGKVVTHAMMAAGHPPLPPIEMATFAKNEPQHWRDPINVPYLAANKDSEKHQKNFHIKDIKFHRTKFALIGNVVAVRETARLARDRAKYDKGKDKVALYWPEFLMPGGASKPTEDDFKSRWPELALAHSDCFACHHDLKYPGFRQERGFGYHVPGQPMQRVAPGRPLVRSWPLAGVKAGLDHAGKADDVNKLGDRLKALAAATNARPFGRPGEIADSADGLIAFCDTLLDDLLASSFDEAKVKDLAKNLAGMYANPKNGIPDYETARQVGSMLIVACQDLGIKDPVLAEFGKELNTEPYFNRGKRIELMLDVTRDALNKPKPATPDDFTKGLEQFREYMVKDFGDQKLLESLIGNQFLTTIRDQLANKDFNASLLKKQFADPLQTLGDEEQRRVLETVGGYDPKPFRERLAQIGKLLGK